MAKGVDKILLAIIIMLVIAGFFIFTSASLGLLARDGATFSSVAFNQIIFGIVGGSAAMFMTSQIYYRHWRQYAFYIFLASIVLTLAVFIPGLSYEHGGARRWIEIAGFSFQPAEFLKIAFVIYVATWFSGINKHITTFTLGVLPFVGIVGIIGVIMLLQPDTDTFLIMAAAGAAMFICAGGRWRDVLLMALAALLLVALLAMVRPYVKDRIFSYFNPETDAQGSNWQVQQSLIAVGSGGLAGRGFGQSIQKFEYLPEPIGDSIFAVYAEEFGFLGSLLLVLLFSAFVFRGYRIATHSPDQFGTLVVVGFVTLIAIQAFLNIAAMVALLPMLGLPLPFISHGGTALLTTLASVGIILNVSRFQKKRI